VITIYHSPHSRSLRVLWLCEELSIPYELHSLKMFSEELKTPDYLAIHPLGKVPAIHDSDGELTLWETSAILQYLVAKYSDGALMPPRDSAAGAKQIQWLEYGENPLTVIMGEIAAHSGPMPEPMRIPALVERGREIAPSLVRIVDRALGENDYILGAEFSAADITLAFGLMIAQHLGYVNEETPAASAYLARALARPAFQRAAAAE